MARAIDANELMVEIQVCSWDSEQDKERAEDLVLGMPTLTPPPAGGGSRWRMKSYFSL